MYENDSGIDIWLLSNTPLIREQQLFIVFLIRDLFFLFLHLCAHMETYRLISFYLFKLEI